MKRLVSAIMVAALLFVGAMDLWAGGAQDKKAEDTAAVTAAGISKFNEAPALAAKVRAGTLPPIDQRLPAEPLVIKPTERIGQYGGTIRMTTQGSPSNYVINCYWLFEPPIQRTQDGKDIYANFLKSYQESPGFKTFTFTIREGLKWSDGVPVTTDDVKFWYDDIFMNENLVPTKPQQMQRNGVPMKLEVVDKYTFRISFVASFPTFAPIFFSVPYGFGWGFPQPAPFVPKHYMSQYHINHNEKAGDLAKEKGFDHWYQLFSSVNAQDVLGRPTLGAWQLAQLTTDSAVFERNPYYFKVDPQGNQLPYVDSLEVRLMSDPQAYRMSVIGGESDFALVYLTVEDYPLLKENEARGGYTVKLWNKWSCGAVTYFPYATYEDPVVRELLQNVKFREALSLAINRDEINRLLYYGRGTTGQVAVPPGSKFHVPELWTYAASYSPDRANALLDELGLKWDAERKFRVMKNGKELFLKIEGFSTPETPTIATARLVKEYWEKVGIKVDYDFSDTGRFITRFRANQVMITTHWVEMLPDAIFRGAIWHSHEWWCKPWSDAFTAGGAAKAQQEGVPSEVVQFFTAIESYQNAMTDADRMRISNQISELWVRNLWGIGTIGGEVPSPLVVKNYLKNVPDTGFSTWFMGFEQQAQPAQFYIQK